MTSRKLHKIALEEHFGHPAAMERNSSGEIDFDSQAASEGVDAQMLKRIWKDLEDVGEMRLARMDGAGIDSAILSLTCPGIQGIKTIDRATKAAREINDALAEYIARNPKRFAGFASLAMQSPKNAATELERCIKTLDFKGVMINGYSNINGDIAYLDEDAFIPFWDAVADFDVPVYLHPRTPFEQRAYKTYPELLGAMWGYGADTAVHALRLVFSGLFDRYPKLNVILGHLGEMLPYAAWRIQHVCRNVFSGKIHGTQLQKRFQDYLSDNFYLTTSGNLSEQALACAVLSVGSDRILFSVDYPYEVMDVAARWIDSAPMAERDRRKIAYENASKLFKL